MTQMSINYITNPQVNSGENINLLGSTINMSCDVFTNAPDKPSKSVTDTYNSRLARAVYTGFKNPTISIQGTYYLNGTHTTGTSATIDFEYIKELVKRGDQICVLKSDMFKTTDNSDGEINVMLKNVSLTNNNENVVEYTIELIEVRSD
jgi:hypothetical protein